MGVYYKTYKDYLNMPVDKNKQAQILKNIKIIRKEKRPQTHSQILEYTCPVCLKYFCISHTLKQYTFKRTLIRKGKCYSMIMCGYNCTRELERAFGKDVKTYRMKGDDEYGEA